MSLTLDHVPGLIESHRASVARSGRKGRSDFLPEHVAKGPPAAAAANRARARAAQTDIAAVMAEMRRQGVTFAGIATTLNEAGETTRRGSRFDAANVFRIIRAYA
jgi:hypothetical protein